MLTASQICSNLFQSAPTTSTYFNLLQYAAPRALSTIVRINSITKLLRATLVIIVIIKEIREMEMGNESVLFIVMLNEYMYVFCVQAMPLYTSWDRELPPKVGYES